MSTTVTYDDAYVVWMMREAKVQSLYFNQDEAQSAAEDAEWFFQQPMEVRKATVAITLKGDGNE